MQANPWLLLTTANRALGILVRGQDACLDQWGRIWIVEVWAVNEFYGTTTILLPPVEEPGHCKADVTFVAQCLYGFDRAFQIKSILLDDNLDGAGGLGIQHYRHVLLL